MTDDEFHFCMGEVKSSHEMVLALNDFDKRQTGGEPKPSGFDDEFRFTGRFAGGLIDDVRRRSAYYLQDFRDGFHPKVLSSVLFCFLQHSLQQLPSVASWR